MTARTLMFQGTGSDVGKSLMVAGLCRAYTRRGLRVVPFKPQNMSNNAAVTSDGGEIGRAQALQAQACGLPALSDMNPVLLKPQSGIGAQVVVQGAVWGSISARDYQALKGSLLERILESRDRLAGKADLLLVEGAGSAAEINLRAGDVANMGFAEAAEAPVVMVGDIDRGGVIASLVGTHALLSTSERRLVAGYVINKFRGDPSLFNGGLEIIERETKLRCFGVVPYLQAARHLPPEDSMALEVERSVCGEGIKIAVPKLLQIANFDDFDPLLCEPGVSLTFVDSDEALPGNADLVILPGTKTTLPALAHLRTQGWDIDLQAHLRRGGAVLGICGGYQMLGKRLSDPEGIEGQDGTVEGLGLLEVETVISRRKKLLEVEGESIQLSAPVKGYEIHMGRTQGPGCRRPMLRLGGALDGAVSEDGLVSGCYLHGLFNSDPFRSAFLAKLGRRGEAGLAFERQVETALDELAEALESALDLDALLAAAR